MTKFNYFSAVVGALFLAALAHVAAVADDVDKEQILGRSGSEVGDFGTEDKDKQTRIFIDGRSASFLGEAAPYSDYEASLGKLEQTLNSQAVDKLFRCATAKNKMITRDLIARELGMYQYWLRVVASFDRLADVPGWVAMEVADCKRNVRNYGGRLSGPAGQVLRCRERLVGLTDEATVADIEKSLTQRDPLRFNYAEIIDR